MSELRKRVIIRELRTDRESKVVYNGLEFVKDEGALFESIQSLGEKAGRNLIAVVLPLASWGGPTTGAGE